MGYGKKKILKNMRNKMENNLEKQYPAAKQKHRFEIEYIKGE